MVRFCCLFFALFMLTGCESAADRAQRRLPDFKAGYSMAAPVRGTKGQSPRPRLIRDDAAFAGNKAYHAGWAPDSIPAAAARLDAARGVRWRWRAHSRSQPIPATALLKSSRKLHRRFNNL